MAKLCADPQVMRYFPYVLSAEQSNKAVDKVSSTIDQYGYGFWAAEITATREFIGFVGISPIEQGFDFAPCVEVGWRLKQSTWGRGYASEAAQAALAYGFNTIGLKEIISMTAVINVPSENVMRKLGMVKDPQTFMHPDVSLESPLCEHVFYRLTRTKFTLNCQ